MSQFKKALDLMKSDLSPEDLLKEVDALGKGLKGVEKVMFEHVYEAMIVEGRHPDYPN